MRFSGYLRKEIQVFIADPIGLVIAILAPILIIAVFDQLDLGNIAFTHDFRETSPTALVLCLGPWLSNLTLASQALYRERLAGTLERLSVTPFSPGLLLATKAIVLG